MKKAKPYECAVNGHHKSRETADECKHPNAHVCKKKPCNVISPKKPKS